jgi:hypothetical protein
MRYADCTAFTCAAGTIQVNSGVVSVIAVCSGWLVNSSSNPLGESGAPASISGWGEPPVPAVVTVPPLLLPALDEGFPALPPLLLDPPVLGEPPAGTEPEPAPAVDVSAPPPFPPAGDPPALAPCFELLEFPQAQVVTALLSKINSSQLRRTIVLTGGSDLRHSFQECRRIAPRLCVRVSSVEFGRM